MALIYVAMGGAFGAVARFGMTGWIYGRYGASFPWGTMLVNVLGSLVLGVAIAYFQGTLVSPELRRGVMIGFLGAFTTFSAFAYESIVLAQDGHWIRAGAYILGSVVLGVAAVIAGLALGSALLRRS